jgi:hypothetical protein
MVPYLYSPWKTQIFSRKAAQDRPRRIAYAGPATDQWDCLATLCTTYIRASRTTRARADGAPSTSRAPLTLPSSPIASQLVFSRSLVFLVLRISAAASVAVASRRRHHHRHLPTHRCLDIAPTELPADLTSAHHHRCQPAPARRSFPLPSPPPPKEITTHPRLSAHPHRIRSPSTPSCPPLCLPRP